MLKATDEYIRKTENIERLHSIFSTLTRSIQNTYLALQNLSQSGFILLERFIGGISQAFTQDTATQFLAVFTQLGEVFVEQHNRFTKFLKDVSEYRVYLAQARETGIAFIHSIENITKTIVDTAESLTPFAQSLVEYFEDVFTTISRGSEFKDLQKNFKELRWLIVSFFSAISVPGAQFIVLFKNIAHVVTYTSDKIVKAIQTIQKYNITPQDIFGSSSDTAQVINTTFIYPLLRITNTLVFLKKEIQKAIGALPQVLAFATKHVILFGKAFSSEFVQLGGIELISQTVENIYVGFSKLYNDIKLAIKSFTQLTSGVSQFQVKLETIGKELAHISITILHVFHDISQAFRVIIEHQDDFIKGIQLGFGTEGLQALSSFVSHLQHTFLNLKDTFLEIFPFVRNIFDIFTHLSDAQAYSFGHVIGQAFQSIVKSVNTVSFVLEKLSKVLLNIVTTTKDGLINFEVDKITQNVQQLKGTFTSFIASIYEKVVHYSNLASEKLSSSLTLGNTNLVNSTVALAKDTLVTPVTKTLSGFEQAIMESSREIAGVFKGSGKMLALIIL